MCTIFFFCIMHQSESSFRIFFLIELLPVISTTLKLVVFLVHRWVSFLNLELFWILLLTRWVLVCRPNYLWFRGLVDQTTGSLVQNNSYPLMARADIATVFPFINSRKKIVCRCLISMCFQQEELCMCDSCS
jgi:hypothetical protein